MAGSLIPHLTVSDGAKAIEFYTTALGAVESYRVPEENGPRLLHAELRLGDDKFYLCGDFPEYCGGTSKTPTALGGSSVTVHLNVGNCDAAVARFTAAGGAVTMPPNDAFWGDRYARVQDPFGHEWSFAHPLPKSEAGGVPAAGGVEPVGASVS
jgi:PhnB protein